MQEEMGLRDMRKLVYVGIILLSILGCENESAAPICGNLVEGENNWIQEQINDLEEVDDKWSFIIEAEYKGELVYSVQGCNPAALYALLYFRCNGEVIEGPYDLNEFENQRVIWKHKDSPCDFSSIAGL